MAGLAGIQDKGKDYVVLSGVHPHEYTCKHSFPVFDRERDDLYLNARKHALGEVADGVWQIDYHVNFNNYWHM